MENIVREGEEPKTDKSPSESSVATGLHSREDEASITDTNDVIPDERTREDFENEMAQETERLGKEYELVDSEVNRLRGDEQIEGAVNSALKSYAANIEALLESVSKEEDLNRKREQLEVLRRNIQGMQGLLWLTGKSDWVKENE